MKPSTSEAARLDDRAGGPKASLVEHGVGPWTECLEVRVGGHDVPLGRQDEQ